ncbi:MAG: DUF3604 domain-containing protein, partial [Luminiphilus sp.]
ILLRMFGGWQLGPELAADPQGVQLADRAGVPMGGQLPAPAPGQTPRFVVFAARDTLGANLDRLQIVKGWVGKDGSSRERVINVSWSGDRAIDPATGRLPPVGSTVDAAASSYDNSIGAATLSGWWQDPDFDPDHPAFYYARVLEIPTPRWSTYDARDLGIEPIQPIAIQERAIGSAIWYQPPEATVVAAKPALP